MFEKNYLEALNHFFNIFHEVVREKTCKLVNIFRTKTTLYYIFGKSTPITDEASASPCLLLAMALTGVS